MLQYQSTPRCKRKKVGAFANAEAAINVELTRNAEEDIDKILEVDEAEVVEDDRNPAQNLQTVSAQTYHNSALKWWREYTCEAIVHMAWKRHIALWLHILSDFQVSTLM